MEKTIFSRIGSNQVIEEQVKSIEERIRICRQVIIDRKKEIEDCEEVLRKLR